MDKHYSQCAAYARHLDCLPGLDDPRRMGASSRCHNHYMRCHNVNKGLINACGGNKGGVPGRNRTCNLLIRSQATVVDYQALVNL